MHTKIFYLHQIRERYPELAIDSADLNREGQYNDVLIVNEAIVFRFARVRAAVATLRREIAVLHSLQSHITLAVPNPVYQYIETEEVGEAFMGYEMIPGQPLCLEDIKAIKTPSYLEKVAGQLAGFLLELHQIQPQLVIPVELPIVDSSEEWVDMYRRIQTSLFPPMRPDARRQVATQFERFLSDPRRRQYTPTLRHGDFGRSNIIYDSESVSVQGIIDFGGIGLGDPAADFAGLLASYGEEFYWLCSAVYPTMDAALERARFYRSTFALQEALFGAENDDRDALRRGMVGFV